MPGLRLMLSPGTPVQSFGQIAAAITKPLGECHWILAGCTFGPPGGGEDRIDQLLLDRDDQRHQLLLSPRFLTEAAEWVHTDWCHIFAVDQPLALRTLKIDRAFAEEARAYFVCVDAAFWEVFSTSESVRDALAATFPSSLTVAFGDRAYLP
jgi:hypothetical protein